MKKIFQDLFTLIVIVFSLFWLLDELFTRVYQNGNYTKTQWIYKIKKQRFDFAVHGSSRGYTTIDVGAIARETHLKGINLSIDGSSIPDQYLLLKIFLEHQNSIQQLYLQVDPVSASTEHIFASTIPKLFPYLKDPFVFDHYKQYGFIWYVYRYVPFYRYAEYNTIWGLHQFLNEFFHLFPKEYDLYGGRFYPVAQYKKPTQYRQFAFDLTSDYKYLNKIIALCQANNIKLVLFTAPYSHVAVDRAYRQNVAAFTKMINAKGITYINYAHAYNHAFNLFYDDVHLNQNGVKSFTAELQESLIKPSFEEAAATLARQK